ncbi:hypothetical protein [Nocardia sp. NPDC051463]|uniref:hypothetical protein n=1 Tax=Nocardia sp. NPDC051463 TaxID=3154845 RepID=UPI003426DA42
MVATWQRSWSGDGRFGGRYWRLDDLSRTLSTKDITAIRVEIINTERYSATHSDGNRKVLIPHGIQLTSHLEIPKGIDTERYSCVVSGGNARPIGILLTFAVHHS